MKKIIILFTLFLSLNFINSIQAMKRSTTLEEAQKAADLEQKFKIVVGTLKYRNIDHPLLNYQLLYDCMTPYEWLTINSRGNRFVLGLACMSIGALCYKDAEAMINFSTYTLSQLKEYYLTLPPSEQQDFFAFLWKDVKNRNAIQRIFSLCIPSILTILLDIRALTSNHTDFFNYLDLLLTNNQITKNCIKQRSLKQFVEDRENCFAIINNYKERTSEYISSKPPAPPHALKSLLNAAAIEFKPRHQQRSSTSTHANELPPYQSIIYRTPPPAYQSIIYQTPP